MDRLRINFIPARIQFAQARKEHLRAWAIGIAVVLLLDAVPVVMHWSAHHEAATRREQAAKLEDQLQDLRKDVQTTTTAAHEASLQLERANALRAKRSWSAMLGLVARSMPASCWLNTLATDPDAPSASASAQPSSPAPNAGPNAIAVKPLARKVVAVEAPRKLRLIGYAINATDPLTFVTRLREQKAFDRIALERTMRGPGPDDPFQFEIVCEW